MNSTKTVGIVGGGQLGRMLTEAAIKLGYEVIVLDPTPNCPAAQVGAEQIEGSWKDSKLIEELVKKADFITIEIEHIDTNMLKKLEELKPINPSSETIKLIQNKFEQKVFLTNHHIDVVDFLEVEDWDHVKKQLNKWGGKLFLKSKFEAYDGRGNWLIDSPEAVNEFMNEQDPKKYYMEKYNDFLAEISVMVTKDMKGSIDSYEATKTIHKRSICIETTTPTNFSSLVNTKAQKLAENSVSKLSGSGVYGVEMFLNSNDEILINEIAPRVHNSGHWTMDGAETSQFENHIRAITGMDIGSTKITVKSVAMVNILGEVDNAEIPKEFPKIDNVKFYWYGKKPVKTDRKMGHINVIGDTIEEAHEKALKARSLIKI